MIFKELIKYIDKERSIIFDLDNTLYDENIFLFKVYENISIFISDKFNIDKYLVYDYLKTTFLYEGRKQLLDKMLTNFTIKNKVNLQELFLFFRENKYFNSFNLNIFPEYLEYLLNQEYHIITNGNIFQQKLKIKLLSLKTDTNIKEIIYSNLFDPKPGVQSFFKLKERIKLVNPIYIGDSYVDREFANNVGMEFIKLDYKLNSEGLIDHNSLKFLKTEYN